MTSCAPDDDFDGCYRGFGADVPFKSKKKFSKRHTPKDKTPPHVSALEDHMAGSRYRADEICSQCGYRRDSTVYCTVSHLHHGTDTPLTPTHRHGRTSPGSKSKRKSHKTPKQHSRSPTNDNNSPHKSTPEYLHGATYSIGDAMITVSAASSPAYGGADEESAPQHDDAYETAAADENTTQYYSYTDEKGDTYYYAAEMKDTVPNSEHHAAADAPDDAPVAEPEHQPQVYMYTYEDENGVQQTVMVQAEPDGAEREEEEEDDADPMMSDVARDGGSQEEDYDSCKKTKKKKRTFASTIGSLFQRRNRRASRVDDSDDDEGGLRQHTDPASGLSALTNVDEAVDAMVESLEPAERKRFDKERRRLVKDLEDHEKAHRSKLTKERRQYVDELVKERRACMLNLLEDGPEPK